LLILESVCGNFLNRSAERCCFQDVFLSLLSIFLSFFPPKRRCRRLFFYTNKIIAVFAYLRPKKMIGALNSRLLFWTFIIPMPFSLCSLPADNAFAAKVTIAWDASSEPDIAGYIIYYGPDSQNYQDSIDLGKSTSCTISGLQEGQTYFFAVTAYDPAYNESGFSEELSYTISGNDSNGGGGGCFISTVAGRQGQTAQQRYAARVKWIIIFIIFCMWTRKALRRRLEPFQRKKWTKCMKG